MVPGAGLGQACIVSASGRRAVAHLLLLGLDRWRGRGRREDVLFEHSKQAFSVQSNAMVPYSARALPYSGGG